MRKFIILAALSVILCGCSVKVYTVQSGIEDAAYITFTDDVKKPIVVNVDGKTYDINTAKEKKFKKEKYVKVLVYNSIKLTPGQHDVTVLVNGAEVYHHKIFLSTGETKIIAL